MQYNGIKHVSQRNNRSRSRVHCLNNNLSDGCKSRTCTYFFIKIYMHVVRTTQYLVAKTFFSLEQNISFIFICRAFYFWSTRHNYIHIKAWISEEILWQYQHMEIHVGSQIFYQSLRQGMIDWLIEWVSDRLIDRLIDWLIDWLMDGLLIDWLIDWFFVVLRHIGSMSAIFRWL